MLAPCFFRCPNSDQTGCRKPLNRRASDGSVGANAQPPNSTARTHRSQVRAGPIDAPGTRLAAVANSQPNNCADIKAMLSKAFVEPIQAILLADKPHVVEDPPVWCNVGVKVLPHRWRAGLELRAE